MILARVCSLLILPLLAASVPANETRPQIEQVSARPAEQEDETNAQKISIGQAAILGVIEGITEYIPVSSTGHLIIANSLISDNPQEFDKRSGTSTFQIIIQIGAILAVAGLYWREIKKMALGVTGRNSEGLRLFWLIALATTPAIIFGLLFHNQIKEKLFNPTVVAAALAVGGIIMIIAQFAYNRKAHKTRNKPKGGLDINSIRWQQALLIGLMQTLSMCPGTSRSMVTIVAGLIVGLNIVAAAEFSFLLALPTLGGATVFELFMNYNVLLKSASPAAIFVGIAVSGIIAALSVKCLIKWLTSHGLVSFGIYRILLAIMICLFFVV